MPWWRRWLRRATRFAVEHRRLLVTGAAVFAIAAIAFRWARRSAGYWSIDDAGITYAAALEYADHGSLAASLEGTPVESYSNPLVFFVVALLRVLHLFDPITTHVRIEMALFAAMVVLLWSTLRRLTGELAAVIGAAVFAAIELLTPATWLWYGSGLENVWASAGLVALLWICVRTARGIALSPAWGVLGFLVALTRPEAPVHVAGFYVALAVVARPPELRWAAHARRVAAALAVTSVLYLGFLCWRRAVYGDWLPNTYYAKIFSAPPLLHNLRRFVLADILPYAYAGLFASAAIALVPVRRFTRVAAALIMLLCASTALPVFAGQDFFMGEHRYATAFLAVSHAACAVLAAVCVAGVREAQRGILRSAAVAGIAGVAALTIALAVYRSERGALYLDDVTIARVGEVMGGERWEHQVRLGVPFGVTMAPDAGGTMLIAGTQYLDNGFLAEFVMAHTGRDFGNEQLRRSLNQYQHEERRPDLLSPGTGTGMLDTSYVGTRYLEGAHTLLARRDLVEVAAIDPAARPVFDDGHLRVYLSDETVLTAAPGALVRCELIVAWDGATLDRVVIRGAVDDGDRDEIALRPYRPGETGIERRALLLGAPDRAGAAAVTIEIARGEAPVFRERVATLDVTGDDAVVARAAEQIVGDGGAMRAARRLAWLREQRLARWGMTEFHSVLHALLVQHARRGSLAGANLLRLRHNVRLATLEPLPDGLRRAELAVTRRLIASCPASSAGDAAVRVACLGRVVDELRRLGYLGTLARVPELAAELARARAELDQLLPEPRYLALVGLTLAEPADIALQRALLALRRQLTRYPALPIVSDRAP